MTYLTTKHPVLFCCVIVAGILIAGLWPLQFHPANMVSQEEHDGLVFGDRGIAYAPNVDWRYSQNSGFSIEAWVNSAGPITSHVGDVICITQNNSCSDFLIGQWRSELIFGARYFDSSGNVSHQEFGVNDGLTTNQWRHIVITSGMLGTRIIVDGVLRQEYSRRLLIENSNGIIVLGNDAVGEEPWKGSIRAIAIYGRAMDDQEVSQRDDVWKNLGTPPAPIQSATWFEFTGQQPPSLSFDRPRQGAVYLPTKFIPPRRAVLRWDARLDRGGIADMVLNFLGFIPFGFIASLTRKQRAGTKAAATWSVILGVALSATIEVTQAFIPGRSSSSTDLLFNSAGTLAGALLFIAYARTILQNRSETQSTSE